MAAIGLLAITTLSACGGDDSANEVALEKARDEGRAEAVAEQRAKQTAKETAALRRELSELRKEQKKQRSSGSSSSNGGGGNGGGGGAAAPAASDDCGGGISVNSSTTSCAFGREVRASFYAGGQSDVVEAFSPATGKSYTLTCSGSTLIVCRGGNNAEVRFR